MRTIRADTAAWLLCCRLTRITFKTHHKTKRSSSQYSLLQYRTLAHRRLPCGKPRDCSTKPSNDKAWRTSNYGTLGFEIRPGIVQCDRMIPLIEEGLMQKLSSLLVGSGAIVGPTDVSGAPRVVFRQIRRASLQPLQPTHICVWSARR